MTHQTEEGYHDYYDEPSYFRYSRNQNDYSPYDGHPQSVSPILDGSTTPHHVPYDQPAVTSEVILEEIASLNMSADFHSSSLPNGRTPPPQDISANKSMNSTQRRRWRLYPMPGPLAPSPTAASPLHVPRDPNQSGYSTGLGVSSLGEPVFGYEEATQYRSVYNSTVRVKDELEKLKGSVHQLDNDVNQVRNVSSRSSTTSTRRFSKDTESTKRVIEEELKGLQGKLSEQKESLLRRHQTELSSRDQERQRLERQLAECQQKLQEALRKTEQATEAKRKLREQLDDALEHLDRESGRSSSHDELRRTLEQEIAVRIKVQTELQKMEKVVTPLFNDLEDMKAKLTAKTKELDNALIANKAVEGDVQQAQELAEQWKSRLVTVEADNQELKTQIDISVSQLDAQREQLRKFALDKEITLQDATQYAKRLQENEQAYAQAEHVWREKEDQLHREASEEILALRQKLHETEMKLAKAERERDSALQDLQTEIAQLNELKSKYATECEKRQTLESELDEIKSGYDNIRGRLSVSEDARNAVEKELQDLRQQYLNDKKDWAERSNVTASELEGVNAKLLREKDEAVHQRDQALQTNAKLSALKDKLVAERDELVAERDELIQDRHEFETEKDDLIKDRNEFEAQRDELAIQRDDYAAQSEELLAQQADIISLRDNAERERDEVIRERDEAIRERNEAILERDEVVQERDEILAERSAILTSKDAMFKDRDVVLQERDNAIEDNEKLVAERDQLVQDMEQTNDLLQEQEKIIEELQQRLEDAEDALSRKATSPRVTFLTEPDARVTELEKELADVNTQLERTKTQHEDEKEKIRTEAEAREKRLQSGLMMLNNKLKSAPASPMPDNSAQLRAQLEDEIKHKNEAMDRIAELEAQIDDFARQLDEPQPEREVIREIIKEVPVEVIKEVPVEVIREVIKEVPVEEGTPIDIEEEDDSELFDDDEIPQSDGVVRVHHYYVLKMQYSIKKYKEIIINLRSEINELHNKMADAQQKMEKETQDLRERILANEEEYAKNKDNKDFEAYLEELEQVREEVMEYEVENSELRSKLAKVEEVVTGDVIINSQPRSPARSRIPTAAGLNGSVLEPRHIDFTPSQQQAEKSDSYLVKENDILREEIEMLKRSLFEKMEESDNAMQEPHFHVPEEEEEEETDEFPPTSTTPIPTQTPTPTSTRTYTPAKTDDEIDMLVSRELPPQAAAIPTNFERLDKGVYRFGTKRINMEIKNGTLVVRVGGGYMTFVEFVNHYGRVEVMKTQRGIERAKSPERRPSPEKRRVEHVPNPTPTLIRRGRDLGLVPAKQQPTKLPNN